MKKEEKAKAVDVDYVIEQIRVLANDIESNTSLPKDRSTCVAIDLISLGWRKI